MVGSGVRTGRGYNIKNNRCELELKQTVNIKQKKYTHSWYTSWIGRRQDRWGLAWFR